MNCNLRDIFEVFQECKLVEGLSVLLRERESY